MPTCDTTFPAFDPMLNAAILTITQSSVGQFVVGDGAPSTYAELKAWLDSGQTLRVTAEGAACTVFGCSDVNYAFRAWHDWCHWRGQFDFSCYGEAATCNLQIEQIRTRFGVNSRTDYWARLLTAEVIGQRQYFERYRTYIVDQRAFARAYLFNPKSALSCRW